MPGKRAKRRLRKQRNAKRRKAKRAGVPDVVVSQGQEQKGKRKEIEQAVYKIMETGKSNPQELAALVTIDDKIEQGLQARVAGLPDDKMIQIMIPLEKGLAKIKISAGDVRTMLSGKESYPMQDQIDSIHGHYCGKQTDAEEREYYWLAINGDSCAACPIPMAKQPSCKPNPELYIGLDSQEKQTAAQQFLLTAPQEKIVGQVEQWEKEGAKVFRSALPAEKPSSQTDWQLC